MATNTVARPVINANENTGAGAGRLSSFFGKPFRSAKALDLNADAVKVEEERKPMTFQDTLVKVKDNKDEEVVEEMARKEKVCHC